MRVLRTAPVTLAYVAAATVTTALLASLGDHVDDHVLLAVSTNLHQLGHVPLRVLLASAFWLGSGWTDLLLWAALFGLVVLPVELRLGSRRTLVAFAAGHVGASLLVAGGLWLALRLNSVDPAVARAKDVGASYGFLAVAAVAACLLPTRLRPAYLGLLCGYVVLGVATSGSFTDYGHLTATAIGLACYPLVRPVTSRRCPQPSRS